MTQDLLQNCYPEPVEMEGFRSKSAKQALNIFLPEWYVHATPSVSLKGAMFVFHKDPVFKVWKCPNISW